MSDVNKKILLKYFNPHFLNKYSCLFVIITMQIVKMHCYLSLDKSSKLPTVSKISNSDLLMHWYEQIFMMVHLWVYIIFICCSLLPIFCKMQLNWTFSNIFRQDYVANEVTLDYNAGFQGAVGKLGGWFQGPLYDKMFLGFLHEFWRNDDVISSDAITKSRKAATQ